MPAKSKSQARLLFGILGGKIKRKGISPGKAKEMLKGTHLKKLPERKGARGGRS